jgi:hypothetical protein
MRSGNSERDGAMTDMGSGDEPYGSLGGRVSAAESVTALKAPIKTPLSSRLQRLVRSPNILPWLLLATLLLGSLLTILTQAHRYGIAIDELFQQPFGIEVLAWYRSLGRNTSFLTTPQSDLYMPEHGGIVDAVIASLQLRLVGVDPWLVRHVATGLIGWLGLVAIALCGFELGGPWLAFAAALGLWLFPRYSGAIYNNPKDIPAAVSMTFVLLATLLLLKYWKHRIRALEVSALLGLYLGVATAIRVTALFWFAIMALLLAGWWIANGASVWRERRMAPELTRQGVISGIIGITWLLSTMALWPFVFLNPFTNLLESIRVMSHYPWNNPVLYGGVTYPATQLPRSYPLSWLVIGSPPMLLPLLGIGLVIALAQIARTRRINPATATVILAFVVPLGTLLILHPVLYDGLRQFLFIVPPLILLAAYGLVQGARSLELIRKQCEGARM